MRRSVATTAAGSAAFLLVLFLLLLVQGARAVQLYYGLDELRDLEAVEIVDARGVVQKHTLLSFSNHACREQGPYSKGFPWNFVHLNGEGFELGQVRVGLVGWVNRPIIVCSALVM